MKPRGVIISKGPDRTSMAERPASLYMRTQPSSLSSCMPGHTCPRKISSASSVGGWRQKNSVASTIPPGQQTRTNSFAARWRSTNIVTASATTRSKVLSPNRSARMSPCSTSISRPRPTRLTLAPGSLEHDRRDVDRGDGGSEPTRHLNRGGPDAAADIECLLPNLQVGQVEEFLG